MPGERARLSHVPVSDSNPAMARRHHDLQAGSPIRQGLRQASLSERIPCQVWQRSPPPKARLTRTEDSLSDNSRSRPRSWRRRQRSSSRPISPEPCLPAGRSPAARFLPARRARAGTRHLGAAGHAPVTGHRPQAAGEHHHKAGHRDQDDIDHDSGEQQPDSDQEPQRRRDDPALVMHPRVGRVHGFSKPRVTGVKRLLDLLELALLMLRERHGALHRTRRGRSCRHSYSAGVYAASFN